MQKIRKGPDCLKNYLGVEICVNNIAIIILFDLLREKSQKRQFLKKTHFLLCYKIDFLLNFLKFSEPYYRPILEFKDVYNYVLRGLVTSGCHIFRLKIPPFGGVFCDQMVHN